MYTQCIRSDGSRRTIGFTCEFIGLIQCPALTRICLSTGRSTARLNNDRPLPSSTVRYVERRNEVLRFFMQSRVVLSLCIQAHRMCSVLYVV